MNQISFARSAILGMETPFSPIVSPASSRLIGPTPHLPGFFKREQDSLGQENSAGI
jgi:hypothetical protein